MITQISRILKNICINIYLGTFLEPKSFDHSHE